MMLCILLVLTSVYSSTNAQPFLPGTADNTDDYIVELKEKLLQPALKTADAKRYIEVALQEDPCEGTWCPEGCCPEVNYFCCMYVYCAPTEGECPYVDVESIWLL